VKGDPGLAGRLKARLKLPVMAGPMFIASTPGLAIAQCRAGVIGAMPALNARTTEALDADMGQIGRGSRIARRLMRSISSAIARMRGFTPIST
jgi:hypothetical protein